MTEPYIGEIRMFGFNFAPRNWAKCNGELLSINQNQSLYSILGTTYGGDGRTSFALPELRGRVPIHKSSTYSLGAKDGVESTTMTEAQMPAHTHTMRGTSDAALSSANGGNDPTGRVLATATTAVYTSAANLTPLSAITVGTNAGGQPIDNMQPFLAIEFCIALVGTFPPRN
ncbi:phage tail protein [Leptothoe spongobia]|uniref:Phage tail protein n=1 Tax=Leptothoe spongobia TAU-MAC 1115 TaxID=1967444 RepID=A0A947DBX4_9CYAN|nr:tail fiber protein [Leptothoe spongobia]MBT9314088.1 phage tail protein [Leptothoe spongobia TAU-MAC 1115]